MKKILALVLALALALCLFAACAAPAADAPADEPADTPADAPADEPSGDKPLIGFSHFNSAANNYCSTYAKHIEQYFDENYADVVDFHMVDAQNDADKQLSDIDDLIAMECDVVILWPVSATACIPGLEALDAAGIPVINTNSGVDASAQDLVMAFSGPSDYKQGYQAGEAMIEALGGKGNVVELAGQAGYDTAIQRTAGFKAAIEEKSEIVILETEPADWSTEKAQTIMETFITKYGDKINGCYCADDGISDGAMNALEAVGKNDGSIAITSATLFASGYDAIAEGKQYGSILQSPLLDAELALDLAVKVANGEEIEWDNRIETFIVSQENYKEFDRPTW